MSDEASNLHEQAIVVVGHSDIVASDVDWRRESGERGVLDRRHLPTLRAGGVTVICDHVGGDAPYGYLPATRLSTSYLQRFMRALDHTHAEIAESSHFILASTTADIHRAKREGKIAIVICLEGGAPLEQEISYLRNFYRLGLRCLGLTHDVRNEIGDGVRERSAGGLTHFGVKCRGRMQSARHRRRRVALVRPGDRGCACGQLAAHHRLALQRAQRSVRIPAT